MLRVQHLLYLTHRIPYPPNKGDKLRSYHFLAYLSRRYRVHLGTFVDDPEDNRYVDAVRAVCGETYFAQLNPSSARVKSVSALLSNKPLTMAYYSDVGLRRWVRDLLVRHPIKHILVFSSAMAQYVSDARHVQRIADFVDVDSDKWAQYSSSRRWPFRMLYQREASRLLHDERVVANAFDATVFVTEAEAKLFQSVAPESARKVSYISNGVDCNYFSPATCFPSPYLKKERVIVFTGAMDYWPNTDAVEWFVQGMFPEVSREFPEARFYIVGAHPTGRVLQLARLPGIHVTGAVSDIRPYLSHAEIVVAPLRIARGVQNKILEAMAMAKVVVASPQAAAGVVAEPDRELLVAHTPFEFVEHLSKLFKEKACAETIGIAARNRMLSDYSWTENISKIERLFSGLVPATDVMSQAGPTLSTITSRFKGVRR